jgi:hypothetical protein
VARQRVVVGTLPLILALVAVLVVIPGRSQEQKPKPTNRPNRIEESLFPIAEYSAVEPADPTERAKQQARGQKYDKSSWGLHPDAASDTVVRVDAIDPNLPALPFDQSAAVILGQITDARAYLSNDKTGVYSVFNVQVNEVFKNSINPSLSPSSVIEVERDGGRVRFPNGRLRMYLISETGMPKVGLRYVLFLSNSDVGFRIITGYELLEGKVYRLDDLPNLQTYDNSDEINFLSHLRTRSNWSERK